MIPSLILFSPLQVSGRDWLPVSLWSVLWLPCSGSSTTQSRSTSACPVPLHLRCQNPWRRSLAWQSKTPLPSPPLPSLASTELLSHSTLVSSQLPKRTRQFSIFMSSALAALQSTDAATTHVYLKTKGWKMDLSLLVYQGWTWYTSVETPVWFYHFLSLGNCWNSNKSHKFPGNLSVFFISCMICQVILILFCTQLNHVKLTPELIQIS